MEDKIKWFEEVLAMEPDSKLFFPLAKLYLENQQSDKAIEQLESGINKYPEHFQARCLLLELVYNRGNEQKAAEQMDDILSNLNETPAFWALWADHLQQKGLLDEAIAARFLTIQGQKEHISWNDVLAEGLKAFKLKKKVDTKEPASRDSGQVQDDSRDFAGSAAQDRQKGQREVSAGSAQLSGESQEGEESATQPGAYRTKTMAEILAGQGDYAGALEIYNQLWSATPPGQERRALEKRMKELEASFDAQHEMEQNSGSEKKKDQDKIEKNKLISSMQALVDRLEARTAAE